MRVIVEFLYAKKITHHSLESHLEVPRENEKNATSEGKGLRMTEKIATSEGRGLRTVDGYVVESWWQSVVAMGDRCKQWWKLTVTGVITIPNLLNKGLCNIAPALKTNFGSLWIN